MAPRTLTWEIVPDTPERRLAEQIELIIYEAMPKNVAQWRISEAAYKVLQIVKARYPLDTSLRDHATGITSPSSPGD